MEDKGRRLGELLVSRGILGAAALEEALEAQEASGRRIGEVLLERGLLDEAALRWALAEQLDLPLVHPEPGALDPEALALVAPDVCRRYGVIPLHLVAEVPGAEPVLTVAAADPSDRAILGDLAARLRRPVRAVAALREEIEAALDRVHGPASAPQVQVRSAALAGPRLEEALGDPTGASLLAGLLEGLVARGAGVLHLLARQGEARVETEEGSVLFAGGGTWHAILLDRVRQLARLPSLPGPGLGRSLERGRFAFAGAAGGEPALLRVSIVRGVEGEEAQLQLLPREGEARGLADLGFTAHQGLAVRLALGKPGLVWVTAPAEDGMGSTLFALAREIPGRGRTVTVEEKVYYRTPEFLQLETIELAEQERGEILRELKYLHFSRVLVDRASPAQLGDLLALAVRRRWVLAGAPEASLEDALGFLSTRAAELPLYGLSLIVHQRLVPLLCPGCRRDAVLGTAERQALGRALGAQAAVFEAGEGCDRCGGRGTRGSRAFFEVLPVDAEVREALYGQARGENRIPRLLERVRPRVGVQVAEAAARGEVSLSEVWDVL